MYLDRGILDRIIIKDKWIYKGIIKKMKVRVIYKIKNQIKNNLNYIKINKMHRKRIYN